MTQPWLLSREEATSINNSQRSRELGHRRSPCGGLRRYHKACVTRGEILEVAQSYEKRPREAWKWRDKKPRRNKNASACSAFSPLLGPTDFTVSAVHSTGTSLPLYAYASFYRLLIFWLFPSRSVDYVKRST